MRSWSIPVGRLFGIEIRIHLTFLFLLVFVWSTEAATQDASAAVRLTQLSNSRTLFPEKNPLSARTSPGGAPQPCSTCSTTGSKESLSLSCWVTRCPTMK